MATRILSAAIALAALSSPLLGAAAPAAASPLGPVPPAGLAITGYVLAGGAPRLIRAEGPWVTDLGVDGYELTPAGDSLRPDPAAAAALAAAHAIGRPASLLVSNFDDRLGDFSPAIGHRLLRSAANRAAVANALAAVAARDGWDGITVDLEALGRADRVGLVDFVALLRALLPAGATLDVDVPAATAPGGEAWAPFDLGALADIADHLVAMAYDEHYEGGPPGPVAGFPWVRRVLAATLGQVPAAKLRLGVAGYGYLWRPGRPTALLTDAAARRLAGARARWSRRQREWNARLPGGGVLWWSDRRSIRPRLALARAAGLQGAALWRLGSVG